MRPFRLTPPTNARPRPARRVFPPALLVFALCLSCVAAHAQSGRRSPKPLSPAPTPAPATRQGESESEGRPKRGDEDTRLSLIIFQLDNAYAGSEWTAQELVMQTLVGRLSSSKDLSASGAGKGTRKEAQERAKKEPKSYVVLVELEEEMMTAANNRGTMSRGDTRTLAVKTYVYEPGTGTLKYVDHTSQRPYRSATTIGGIRLPVPAPRTRVERFPNELELEQAARDAADRLMLRFNLRPPPDN